MQKNQIKYLSIYDSYKKTNVTLVDRDTDLSIFKKDECVETIKKGVVKMYHCGITAYAYPSIGNLYASLFSDFINKGLKFIGFETHYVQNITDVGHLVGDGDDDKNISDAEDKLQIASKKEGKKVQEIVKFYSDEYRKECKSLNISLPENMPFASQYIIGQMEIAIKLLNAKRAYLIDGFGIYFDYEANKDLDVPFDVDMSGDGKYTSRDIKTSAKHEKDFVLWKFVSDDTIQKWKFEDFPQVLNILEDKSIKSIWGCPGWHGECVAMISTIFTDQDKDGFFVKNILSSNLQAVIDIHTGGEDHIPIHHQNEIWQSKCLGYNLSSLWVHNKHILVDGRTMSKSKGNSYYVLGNDKPNDSIEKMEIDPLAFRMFALEHNYRSVLDFTWEKLKKSELRLINLRRDVAKLSTSIDFSAENNQNDLYFEFLRMIKDDFRTCDILDLVQKTINLILNNMSDDNGDLSVLFNLDKSFLNLNLFINKVSDKYKQALLIAKERMVAKDAKDFELADKLRSKLKDSSYGVDDYAGGKFGLYCLNSLKDK